MTTDGGRSAPAQHTPRDMERRGTGPAAAILIDWGTTSCRFALVDDAGELLALRTGRGIVPAVDALGVHERNDPAARSRAFRAEVDARIGDWLDDRPGIPVLACGMIGSTRGWIDAGYRGLPAPLAPPVEHLAGVDVGSSRMHIVPGLRQDAPADVIRGEETQVLGAVLAEHAGRPLEEVDAVVVTPGTHSKWIEVRGGRTVAFRTYMTGDLYSALTEHTIIAAEIPGDDTPASDRCFRRGVEQVLDGSRASLSRHLFTGRSAVVTGGLEPEGIADFVSGLLIGDEVRDALTCIDLPAEGQVLVVADEPLASRYLIALEHCGVDARRIADHPTLRGLVGIASRAGLLGDTDVTTPAPAPEEAA